nr:DNA cytosine methyltransferase [Microbacterium sp. PAMC21962]
MVPSDPAAPLRVGSLFSGYGGLDLAVEEVFGAKTIWFSEINEPIARVFSHHWPDAPTSATSPPSTGTLSRRWTSSAAGSHAKTYPRSGRWPA